MGPFEAFAALASEAVALKDYFASRVTELRVLHARSNDAAVRAEVALYERAMDRAGRFLTDWVRLGIDDRLVKVQEEQVRVVTEALDRTLDELGISHPDVKRVLGRHLRAIEGGTLTPSDDKRGA